MHIPDGFLSPATYLTSTAIAAPLLYIAFKKTREAINDESFSLISALTAFSFVIMMFNIPIPGGTSGHAIGTAIISILYGPWIASFCVSLTLIIQALVFGDGGITVFPVNSLAMGFTAAFASHFVYKLLNGKINNKVALFISGWSGIVLASVVVAIALGIQPIFGTNSAGHPLYFPFGLSVTIPAIVGSHMLFFGLAEGIATMLVIEFINKISAKTSEEEVVA